MWCFVDQNACDVAYDPSDYFAGSGLHYSYETCGSSSTSYEQHQRCITGCLTNAVVPSVSFFLAETIKYLFLLFSEPEEVPIDLDRFVLTTEAHVLPVLAPARASADTESGEACDSGDDESSSAEDDERDTPRPIYPPWWRDDAMLDE